MWDGVQEWLLEGYNAPLLLVLLLLGWLWMLVRRREEGQRRPKRPEPLNLDELGRLAFQAARGRDLHLWRDLFINGAEARDLLGDRAKSFLESRSPQVLAAVLDAVGDAIPADSRFGGMVTAEDGTHALQAVSESGTVDVPLGRSVQVGVTFRLVGGSLD